MEELHGIFEKLRAFQIKSGELKGAFSRELSEGNVPNEDMAGPFSTIEGVYPFLIHPEKNKNATLLMEALEYLISDCGNNNNLVRIFPEYADAEQQQSYVDSNAFGLFILTLGRSFLSNYHHVTSKQKVIDSTNEIIANIIRHINDSKIAHNRKEYGWPLIQYSSRDIEIFPRTYSTALVVLALNNCTDDDFSRSGITKGRNLVEYGVNYLLSEQNTDKTSSHYGGWGFAPSNNGHGSSNGQSVNPNITADVCFALAHTIRNPWNPRGNHVKRYYDRIGSSIKTGIAYIEKVHAEREGQLFQNVDETVMYISRGNKKIEYLFTHPISMILPALLVSPGVFIKSDFVQKILEKISEEVGQREIYQDWKIFNFSDLAIAHTYYYTLLHGFEGLIDKFTREGEIAICLINGHIEQCPHVTLYEGDEGESPVVEIGDYIRTPNLQQVDRALEEFNKLSEGLFGSIKTETILKNMKYSSEFARESAEWATIKLQQILPYEMAQRLCLVLCGSVGRLEASGSSDIDFYVLFNDLSESMGESEKTRIMKHSHDALKSFAIWLKEHRCVEVDDYRNILTPDYLSRVDPKETHFPTLFPVSSILGKVGNSSEDVEELKTKRQAIICESIPVFNDDLFYGLREKVLDDYEFDSYISVSQVAKPLITEIENLYSSYYTRSQKLKKTNDLRTIKIWHMRSLSFVGITTRVNCLSLGKEEITRQMVDRILGYPPILRVAELGAVVEDVRSKVLEIVEKYNDSLNALNSVEIRNYLRKGKIKPDQETSLEGIKMDLLTRSKKVEELLQEIKIQIEEKVRLKYGQKSERQ
ncbi:hypothetical protein HQ531_04955 [bacterium]|nr:hypothetical protein [bacterium]